MARMPLPHAQKAAPPVDPDGEGDGQLARFALSLLTCERLDAIPQICGPGFCEPFGIRGLHERAGTVGGWVDLSSGPAGTTLILSVPLNTPGDTAPMPTGPGGEPDDPSQWGSL